MFQSAFTQLLFKLVRQQNVPLVLSPYCLPLNDGQLLNSGKDRNPTSCCMFGLVAPPRVRLCHSNDDD
jgi:hypothetical protein